MHFSKLKPPIKQGIDLLVIAGEHSGDELAADFVREIKAKHPELVIASIGGLKLAQAGADSIFNLVNHSVFGFVDVLKNYPFFKSLFKETIAWIETYKPRHICCVDYPGFNLRIAKALKKRGISKKGGGAIGVHHYVSPQIWAWKPKRRFAMAECLDSLAVILPFESRYYEDTDLPITYVGHPFAKSDYKLPLKYDAEGPVLLLPGSRQKSVETIAPIILDAFAEIAAKDDSLKAVVVYPSLLIKSVLEQCLLLHPKLENRVHLVKNDFTELKARAAIMSSGTMSLSVAILGIPGIVVYSLSRVNYWIIKRLVKVPHISLANLILEKEIYPELIQDSASKENITDAFSGLLEDEGIKGRYQKCALDLKNQLFDEREKSAAEWLCTEIIEN